MHMETPPHGSSLALAHVKCLVLLLFVCFVFVTPIFAAVACNLTSELSSLLTWSIASGPSHENEKRTNF
jgi:hypothetical protein